MFHSFIVYMFHYLFVISFGNAFRNGESPLIDDVPPKMKCFFAMFENHKTRYLQCWWVITPHVVFAAAALDFQTPCEPEVAQLKPLGSMVIDGASRRGQQADEH